MQISTRYSGEPKEKADAALNRTSLKIWAGIVAVIVILIVIVPLIAGFIWHK